MKTRPKTTIVRYNATQKSVFPDYSKEAEEEHQSFQRDHLRIVARPISPLLPVHPDARVTPTYPSVELKNLHSEIEHLNNKMARQGPRSSQGSAAGAGSPRLLSPRMDGEIVAKGSSNQLLLSIEASRRPISQSPQSSLHNRRFINSLLAAELQENGRNLDFERYMVWKEKNVIGNIDRFATPDLQKPTVVAAVRE